MIAPKVSILIPVYNREFFIGDCIKSALAQTITDIEVIIVDNASTDSTWKICQYYATIDSRVRIFQNGENIGPVKNWKRCMEEAKGKYGKLLFSDDSISPEFIEKSLPFLEQENVGLVFSSVTIGTDPSHILRQAFCWKMVSNLYPSSDFIENALFSGAVPVSPGAALFRMKDLISSLVVNLNSLQHHDFSSHGAGPDLLLYLIIANKYEKIGYIAKPLAFFRSHPGSLTNQYHKEFRSHYLQAKIWFASHYGGEIMLARLIFRGWLASLRNIQWMWFRSYAISYGVSKMSLTTVIHLVLLNRVVALGHSSKKRG